MVKTPYGLTSSPLSRTPCDPRESYNGHGSEGPDPTDFEGSWAPAHALQAPGAVSAEHAVHAAGVMRHGASMSEAH